MSWFILSQINDGYPFNSEFPDSIVSGWTNSDSVSLPSTLWRIAPTVNDGYPFTWWHIAVDNGYINSDDMAIGSDVAYDYGGGGSTDPNTYSDVTDISVKQFRTSNMFNMTYAANFDTMLGLRSYLYQVIAPTATQDVLRQKFLNANPIDCIVNLQFFPFDLSDYYPIQIQLQLGNQPVTDYNDNPVNARGQSLLNTAMQIIIDMGSVVYFPYFGDFRDYEPYSSAELIIPYHGSLSISPAEYMGHTIGVKCVVDLATGSSIAYIYRDSLIVDSINGIVGVQIPISGIAQADYNNAAYQAAAQLNAAKITQAAGFASDAIGLVASAVTANPLALASSATKIMADTAQSAVSVDIAQYNVSHVKIPFRQTGTSSSAAATAGDQVARLIVRRPKMLQYDQDVYAHVNGFACLMCDTLDKFTGFTVVSDVEIPGSATAEEKNMIRSLLQSGVYL